LQEYFLTTKAKNWSPRKGPAPSVRIRGGKKETIQRGQGKKRTNQKEKKRKERGKKNCRKERSWGGSFNSEYSFQRVN